MRIRWKALMEALRVQIRICDDAGQSPCPIHPDDMLCLQIRHHPITGETHFTCRNPKCGFHGTAPMLVARCRNIDIDAAIELFRRGNELNHCLVDADDPGLSGAELQAYRATQLREQYLADGKTELRYSVQTAPIREFLMDRGILRHGDPTFRTAVQSLATPPRDHRPAPPGFNFQRASRIRGLPILFPYRFCGLLVRVTLWTPERIANHGYRQLFQSTPLGVFNEEAVAPDAAALYCSPDAAAAACLHRRLQDWRPSSPAVVAADHLPLPDMPALKTLVLLSLRDAPLDLALAICLWSAPHVTENHQPVQLRVFEDNQPSDSVALEGLLIRRSEQLPALVEWIARTMVRRYDGTVAQSLGELSPPDPIAPEKLQQLTDLLLQYSTLKDTNNMLAVLLNPRTRTYELANRSRVQVGPFGMRCITASGCLIRVANFQLVILAKWVDARQELWYRVRVILSTGATMTFTVTARRMIRSIKSFRTLLTQEALARSITDAYPALYRYDGLPPFFWTDLVARMASESPVEHLPTERIDR